MFVSRLQGLQAQLDLEYDQYEKDLEKRDHKAQIEPYDWNDLECRYLEDMEPAIKSEQDIQTNLAQRYGVCLLREPRVRCLLTIYRECSFGCRLPVIAKHTEPSRGTILVLSALVLC